MCAYVRVCLKCFKSCGSVYSVVLGYLLIVFDLYARVIRHYFNDMVFSPWYVNEFRGAFLFSNFSMDCSTVSTHLHESNTPLHALVTRRSLAHLLIHRVHGFSFHFCTIVFYLNYFVFARQPARHWDWLLLLFCNWCEMVSFLACNPQYKRVTVCIVYAVFSTYNHFLAFNVCTTRIIISSILQLFISSA